MWKQQKHPELETQIEEYSRQEKRFVSVVVWKSGEQTWKKRTWKKRNRTIGWKEKSFVDKEKSRVKERIEFRILRWLSIRKAWKVVCVARSERTNNPAMFHGKAEQIYACSFQFCFQNGFYKLAKPHRWNHRNPTRCDFHSFSRWGKKSQLFDGCDRVSFLSKQLEKTEETVCEEFGKSQNAAFVE